MIHQGSAAYNDGSGPREGVAIKAVDERTFQMELVGPIPYALGCWSLCLRNLPDERHHEIGPAWTLPENFVGNGPFVLKEWRPQEMIILARNPKYWDAAAVKIDTVVMYPIDIITTAHTMYLNGEIDWDTNVPLDQIDAIRNRPDYHVDPQLASYYYCFNMIKKPFDDVRVRRALSMAIDRTDIVTQVTKSGEIPAYSMTPPMRGMCLRHEEGLLRGSPAPPCRSRYPGGKVFRNLSSSITR
jgi:oligopeptide transport system substrate-binding protein